MDCCCFLDLLLFGRQQAKSAFWPPTTAQDISIEVLNGDVECCQSP
jgi:hypothetical protein